MSEMQAKIDAYLDGSIEEASFEALCDWLAEDGSHRREFARAAALHAGVADWSKDLTGGLLLPDLQLGPDQPRSDDSDWFDALSELEEHAPRAVAMVDLTDEVKRRDFEARRQQHLRRRAAAGSETEINRPLVVPVWAVVLGVAALIAIVATLVLPLIGEKDTSPRMATDRAPAPQRPSADQPMVLGRVTDQLDAYWADGSSVQPGDTVCEGVYRLASGVVEVRLDNGVRLTIEAPAVFSATGMKRLEFVEGRLCGEVPVNARGFTVVTPDADVVDLGTEFAVDVATAGTTHVQVFTGEVTVAASAAASGAAVSVLQGEARRVAGDRVRPAAFAEHAYLREVPTAYEMMVRELNPLGWWSFEAEERGRVPDRGRAGADVLSSARRQPFEAQQGDALAINGDRDPLRLGSTRAFNLTNNFTIEAWVRVDGSTELSSRVFSNREADMQGGYGFGLTGRDLHRQGITCRDESGRTFRPGPLSLKFTLFGQVDVITERPIPTGEWVQIVAVCSSQRPIRLYINGQRVRAGVQLAQDRDALAPWLESAPAFATTQTPVIGRNPDGTLAEPFVGDLDELVVYDTALTDDNIEELYERGIDTAAADAASLPTAPGRRSARR